MAKTFPADNWTPDSATEGEWGTNIDHDTSQYRTGGASVKFYGASTDWLYLVSDFIPITEGAAYEAGCVVRSSSVAAGDLVYMAVLTYQQDQSSLVDTHTIHNAVLGTANSWERYSDRFLAGATASWAQIWIGRPSDGTGYDVYFDRATLRRFPHVFKTKMDAVTSISSGGTWEQITNFQPTPDINLGFTWSDANQRVTIVHPGIYEIQAAAKIQNLHDDDYFELGIDINGTITHSLGRIYGGSTSADDPLITGCVPVLDLDEDDTVEIWSRQTSSSARNVGGGSDYEHTWQMIRRGFF
jgi:hypothetical protein